MNAVNYPMTSTIDLIKGAIAALLLISYSSLLGYLCRGRDSYLSIDNPPVLQQLTRPQGQRD